MSEEQDVQIVEEHAPDGWLRARVPMREGKIHGEVAGYEADGAVSYRANLVGGVQQGETRLYAEGKLLQTMQFKDGLKHGEMVYYEDGAIVARIGFAEGLQEGLAVTYGPNECKVSSIPHRKGKPNGEARYFDQEERLIRSLHYLDGKQQGPETTYFPDGGIAERGMAVGAKREGGWVS